MEISYDAAKNERNIRQRRLSFERAADFDFETASFRAEVRYGELRRVRSATLTDACTCSATFRWARASA